MKKQLTIGVERREIFENVMEKYLGENIEFRGITDKDSDLNKDGKESLLVTLSRYYPNFYEHGQKDLNDVDVDIIEITAFQRYIFRELDKEEKFSKDDFEAINEYRDEIIRFVLFNQLPTDTNFTINTGSTKDGFKKQIVSLADIRRVFQICFVDGVFNPELEKKVKDDVIAHDVNIDLIEGIRERYAEINPALPEDIKMVTQRQLQNEDMTYRNKNAELMANVNGVLKINKEDANNIFMNFMSELCGIKYGNNNGLYHVSIMVDVNLKIVDENIVIKDEAIKRSIVILHDGTNALLDNLKKTFF